MTKDSAGEKFALEPSTSSDRCPGRVSFARSFARFLYTLNSFQVADQYAFIPREAISKFLLFCIDCQRKNSIENRGGNHGNGSTKSNRSESPIDVVTTPTSDQGKEAAGKSNGDGGSVSSSEYLGALSPAPSLVDQLRRASPFSSNGAAVNAAAAAAAITGNLSPPTTPITITPGPATTTATLNPTAAAALSQAMVAMQQSNALTRSIQMRNSLLTAAATANNQVATTDAAGSGTATPSALLASQAAAMFNHQSSLFAANLKAAAASAAGGEIDFSLPITSTYLRRMRALGLAAGIEQGYGAAGVQQQQVRNTPLNFTAKVVQLVHKGRERSLQGLFIITKGD